MNNVFVVSPAQERLFQFMVAGLTGLLIVLCSPQEAFGAAGDSQIVSVSCPGTSEQAPIGSEINFTTTCTVNISVDPADSPVQLQMRVTSDTTTKTAGNGGNLTITSPENRLIANGSFGITTAGSPTTVESGITGNTTLNLTYKTWEADVGDTSYIQTFELQLLNSGGAPVTQGWYSTGTSLSLTTKNITEVSVLAAPTVTLTTSNEVFSQNTYYDSNSFTVRVKANNSWILKTQMARNPTDDSTTETINVNNVYYRCNTSGNYDCLHSSNTQFATTATYYDVAQNNVGDPTTGSSDNRALDTVDVTVLYAGRTSTNVYPKSDYTSDTTFQVTAPR